MSGRVELRVDGLTIFDAEGVQVAVMILTRIGKGAAFKVERAGVPELDVDLDDVALGHLCRLTQEAHVAACVEIASEPVEPRVPRREPQLPAVHSAWP